MNDRFKFRVYLKAHKQMCNVHTLHTGTNKVIISTRYGNSSVQINDYNILMQCTGLKDKNGKLIYEGDIIQIPGDYDMYGQFAGEKREIYFNEGGFRLKPKWDKNSRGNWLEDTEGFEIIGNIYENEELLNEH